MHENGEPAHIKFLEKLREGGRITALDVRPVFDALSSEVWEMYCFMGDDILSSVDLYDRRVGLPLDWEFKECILLIANLKKRSRQLTRSDKESD